MAKKKEEPEEEQEQQPKEKGWEVNLLIVDDDKPPKKYITKGKETLTEHAALAKILNEVEDIKKALLS